MHRDLFVSSTKRTSDGSVSDENDRRVKGRRRGREWAGNREIMREAKEWSMEVFNG